MLFLLPALLRPVRRLTERESAALSGSGNTGWKAEGYGKLPKH
jgi:hypothetical protein